jgi:hypothetical protein
LTHAEVIRRRVPPALALLRVQLDGGQALKSTIGTALPSRHSSVTGIIWAVESRKVEIVRRQFEALDALEHLER